MPGNNCAVFGCSNNNKKLTRWKHLECEVHKPLLHMDCPCLLPYSMHSFPKDEDLKKLWVKAMNRKDFQPNKKSNFVCSIHFEGGRPSELCRVPSKHLGYDKPNKKQPCRALKKHCDISGITPKIKISKKEKLPMTEIEDSTEMDETIAELNTDSLISVTANEINQGTDNVNLGNIKVGTSEVACQFNLEMVNSSTQYFLHDDHQYCKKAQFTRTVGTQTDLPQFSRTLCFLGEIISLSNSLRAT